MIDPFDTPSEFSGKPDVPRRDLVGDVKKICDGYGHVAEGQFPSGSTLWLRQKLVDEETQETAKGYGCKAEPWRIHPDNLPVNLVEIADGHIDSVVVHLGALLHIFGEDCTRELWAEVQRTNEAKIGPDGKVIRRADGKVLKPADWTPPDVRGILERYGFLKSAGEQKAPPWVGCDGDLTHVCGKGCDPEPESDRPTGRIEVQNALLAAYGIIPGPVEKEEPNEPLCQGMGHPHDGDHYDPPLDRDELLALNGMPEKEAEVDLPGELFVGELKGGGFAACVNGHGAAPGSSFVYGTRSAAAEGALRFFKGMK